MQIPIYDPNLPALSAPRLQQVKLKNLIFNIIFVELSSWFLGVKIIWLKGHKVLTTLESIFFSSKSSAVLFRLHLIKHTKMSYWVGYMRTFWSDLFKGSSSISIYLGKRYHKQNIFTKVFTLLLCTGYCRIVELIEEQISFKTSQPWICNVKPGKGSW